MFRAPMLNKKDLRNTLESIAISPLLQLSGTEQWKTLPADKISAPRAQLSGRALPYCVFFYLGSILLQVKGFFLSLCPLWVPPASDWKVAAGIWSLEHHCDLRPPYCFSHFEGKFAAILQETLYTQHFTTFLTFSPWLISTMMGIFDAAQCAFPNVSIYRRDSMWARWCYTDMYVPNAIRVSKRPHEKITLYNKKRSKGVVAVKALLLGNQEIVI